MYIVDVQKLCRAKSFIGGRGAGGVGWVSGTISGGLVGGDPPPEVTITDADVSRVRLVVRRPERQ